MLKKRTCLETQLGYMMSGRHNMSASFLLWFVGHVAHYVESTHEHVYSETLLLLSIATLLVVGVWHFLQMDTDSYIIFRYKIIQTYTQSQSISVRVYKLSSKHVPTPELHFMNDKFCSSSWHKELKSVTQTHTLSLTHTAHIVSVYIHQRISVLSASLTTTCKAAILRGEDALAENSMFYIYNPRNESREYSRGHFLVTPSPTVSICSCLPSVTRFQCGTWER